MSVSAVARSPITPVAPVAVVNGWEVSTRRSSASLQLTDLTWLAKVAVTADANGVFTEGHQTPFRTARRRMGAKLMR